MMLFIISLIVGIHVASYGSFKDSPYENFIIVKVFREIILCILIFLVLNIYFKSFILGEKYYVLFSLILIISRIVTELYKQFFRVEDQKQYKIPSQVHVFKKIPENRLTRLILIFPVLFAIFLIYKLTLNIYSLYIDSILKGFLIGLSGGVLTAIGGGYKDGFFEGFDLLKFWRSPIIGSLAGVFLASKTQNSLFILLASMGYERMIVEFHKGFLKSGYVPGKFKLKKALYPVWLDNRKIIYWPYLTSWTLFLVLIILDI